jgi:DNA (cytosine-5)-methyltransferase 1
MGPQMRVVSLFSGIGGFELGLYRAGHETVLMCENDDLARAVLHHRFPGVTVRKDVRSLKQLPECDILTAGWPCQDLSQAGKTAGLNGRSSGLISEVFRVVEASRHKPDYILLENVAFALHLHAGAALKYVTASLERLGYRWAYRILDSRQFGVPQRRRRVFILGSRQVLPQSILFRGASKLEGADETSADMFGFYWTEGNTGLGWSPGAVPPLKGGSSLSIPSPPAIWDKRSGSFLTPGISDAERMQGFPSGWTAVGALKTKKKRGRWKLVGNAVSVPVVEWIGRGISGSKEAEYETPVSRTFTKSANAAFGGKGQSQSYFSFGHEGSDSPDIGSLENFSLIDATDLSARAASGFLSRIEKSNLKTHPNFIPDLRNFVS